MTNIWHWKSWNFNNFRLYSEPFKIVFIFSNVELISHSLTEFWKFSNEKQLINFYWPFVRYLFQNIGLLCQGQGCGASIAQSYFRLRVGDLHSRATWRLWLGCAPQGCGPQGCSPQGCAPQGCAPQGCAPQGCAPQGCAPQGCAPQGRYQNVGLLCQGFGALVARGVCVWHRLYGVSVAPRQVCKFFDGVSVERAVWFCRPPYDALVAHPSRRETLHSTRQWLLRVFRVARRGSGRGGADGLRPPNNRHACQGGALSGRFQGYGVSVPWCVCVWHPHYGCAPRGCAPQGCAPQGCHNFWRSSDLTSRVLRCCVQRGRP